MVKKIAVLTSGGDAPGMNSAIRAVVRMSESMNIEVHGILEGYKGLIKGNYKQLNLIDVENIISLGGTILKTSRCDEFLTDEGFNKALKFVKTQAYDGLIVLGGDGSIRGAKKLGENGVKVCAIPCTIDNDVCYTDYTIGFDTAVNTVTTLLNNVRETSASHNRVCVCEVMGRHSGQIALYAGASIGAEVILVPEIKTDIKDVCLKIEKSVNQGEKCVLVVVAEGVGSADEIAKAINNELNIDAKSVDFGYIQRGGSPTMLDRVISTQMAVTAVDRILNNKTGVAVGVEKGEIITVPLKKVFAYHKKFNENLLKMNDILSV